jgi:hypothetical protein
VNNSDHCIHLLESIRALDYQIMELDLDSPELARLELQREDLKKELYGLLSHAA